LITTRHASLGDVTKLVIFSRKMHQQSDWNWVPFSPAALRKSLAMMVKRSDYCVLMAEKDGDLCGFLYGTIDSVIYGNTMFATDIEFAAEAGGDQLLDTFREWAKNNGAKVLIMGVSNAGRESAKDRFFSKHGLTRTGGLHQERL
jgi:hypothetical protein